MNKKPLGLIFAVLSVISLFYSCSTLINDYNYKDSAAKLGFCFLFGIISILLFAFSDSDSSQEEKKTYNSNNKITSYKSKENETADIETQKDTKLTQINDDSSEIILTNEKNNELDRNETINDNKPAQVNDDSTNNVLIDTRTEDIPKPYKTKNEDGSYTLHTPHGNFTLNMGMSGTSSNKETEESETIMKDTVCITPLKLSSMKALRSFKNYVVIDFETTGLSPENDKIVEVACMKVIDGISYEFQTLINPKIHIPSRITKINGLSDNDVADSPTIDTVVIQIHEFCGELPFVAHNASFDMRFLKQSYIDAGIEANLIYVDTLQLARKAFPDFTTHKLSYLIEQFELASEQTHRAMDDVICTKKLLDICIDKLIKDKQKVKQKV